MGVSGFGGGLNMVRNIFLIRYIFQPQKSKGSQQLQQTRQETLNALDIAAKGALPERGPRGGVIWPLRYFVRRVAWHVLDHAWEIEDRVV
jgi:hypothetical protein